MTDWVRPAKTCSRCKKDWRFGFTWPEGYVCRSCVTRAVKLRGPCPRCGDERLLVGRDDARRPICVDCAGISTCFRCETCGREGGTWYSRTCVACSLARRLPPLLDDGTGKVASALVPLFERLVAARNPLSIMTWLNKAPVRRRLASLATGTTPLTHEGIDGLEGTQGREFLRELLIDVGLLPARDKYLTAFERWRVGRLERTPDEAAAREVEIYLSWRIERDLRVRAAAGPLPAQAANRARDQVDAAVRVLAFLQDRGRQLSECRQADLDDFFATASNPAIAIDFLTFSMTRRRCPRLCIPERRARSSPGCTATCIAELVRQLIGDESLAIADRVAGLLVLLFAQPVTRIAELELGDVDDAGNRVTLALGPDPIEVPDALAALLRRYVSERVNEQTTNVATTFLFPGGRPGHHVTPAGLTARLNRVGVTKTERQGALTYLLSEVPAPVVARMTGYSSGTTALRAAQAGSDWSGYVALRNVSSS